MDFSILSSRRSFGIFAEHIFGDGLLILISIYALQMDGTTGQLGDTIETAAIN